MKTYLDTLLFIGRSLTLSLYPKRIELVKAQIQNENINWEHVVQLSSSELVLPTLYIQLKKSKLLPLLPQDLVEHFAYLTQLNKERNEQIKLQIDEIHTTLTQHHITPVFLKGTALLLAGEYDNIGERMMGDIDILVKDKDVNKAAKILIGKGYKPVENYNPDKHHSAKHYPRLSNKQHPAALEIHRQIVHPPYFRSLTGEDIIKDKQQQKKGLYTPSLDHMIIHNVLNVQVNDRSYLYAAVNMRQMYDMMLLARHQQPAKVINTWGKYKKLSNAWLAATQYVLKIPEYISYRKTIRMRLFLWRFKYLLKHTGKIHRAHYITIYLYERLNSYTNTLLKASYNKEARHWLITRLKQPRWYKRHLSFYTSIFKRK